MAEEVVKPPTILITVDESGSLNVHIEGFNPVMLWGLAKVLERRADEIQMQAEAAAIIRKPKLTI
jgi:hypothetical protein